MAASKASGEEGGGASGPPRTFFQRLFHTLYGDMTMSDLLRVFWFAATLFFIIGYVVMVMTIGTTTTISWSGRTVRANPSELLSVPSVVLGVGVQGVLAASFS